MKGCSPINTCDAIEGSLEYLRTGLEHGKQSIGMSRMAGLELRQARMFGALLRAAHDTHNTRSSKIGAFEYAIYVTEHMPQHK